MPFLRFLGNLCLALALIALSVLILGTAYGAMAVRVQEREGLDVDAQRGGWLWVEGQPIYYRTWGPQAGRAIVLVHGYQVEGSETWVPLAEALARTGLRVVAIDLKGFGRSSREAPYEGLQGQAYTLGAALNQMGLYENTLVAHGWGAAVVAQLAADQPQFVRHIVLISPKAPAPLPRWKVLLLKMPYVGDALIWAEEDGGPLWRMRQRQAFADPTLIPRDYWKRITTPVRIVGTAEALRAMALVPQNEIVSLTFSVPTLILVGERDRTWPEERAQALAQEIPQAEVRILSKVGCYAHIEAYAQVSRYIAQWAFE